MTPQQKALQDCITALENVEPNGGYGYYRPANPHDFQPDHECCSEKEIAAHKAACEAYDKGEYTPEKGDGWVSPNLHVLKAPWGIGTYQIVDPAITAAITQAKQALDDQFVDANKMVQPTVHEVEYQRVRGEAQQLAVSLWTKHYRDDAPQWTVLDDALGALSQISNMVAGMVRPQASEPQEADPNAPWLTKAHMLCTDHGIPQGNLTERIRALRDKLEQQASEPAEKRTLYECTGCGHLHSERVSSCDCGENPGNTYNLWTAAPEATK
jgi:hypothetical protein